jgi:predicted nucleotidyltransferase
MGRVLTPHALENKFYPSDRGHQLAAEEYMVKMACLQEFYGETAPQDYMVYGSVAEGRENFRSDLDILVVRHESFAINALYTVLTYIDEKYHVGVEAKIVTCQQAQSGHSAIAKDSLFLSYLRKSEMNSGYVVGKPAEKIKSNPNSTSVHDELLDYFAAKVDGFQTVTPSSFTEVSYHSYQRALELPSKIKQKFEQMSVNPEVDESDEYKLLCQQDKRYTEFLKSILENGGPNQREIQQYDQFTRSEYPGAVLNAGRLSLLAYSRLATDNFLRNETER